MTASASAPARTEPPAATACAVGAVASRFRPRRLLPAAGSALAGVVLAAAFPPLGWWWLAPLAVAGLLLAVRTQPLRPAYGMGVLFAVAFLLPLLSWTQVAGVDGWLLLVGAQGLLLGLAGPGFALVQRLSAWPPAAAAVWVVAEAIRDRVPFGGFPWGRLAFSQGYTPFTPLAALGGAPLVSFTVALTGSLLAATALAAHRSSRRAAAVGLVGALSVGAVGLAVPTPLSGPSAVVAVVQGNVPRLGFAGLQQEAAVLRNHLDATVELAAEVRAGTVPVPDLVIWPENATDVDPSTDPQVADAISRAAADIGRPILVGAVLDGPGPTHVSNAGLLWGPSGPLGQRYVKRRPVPFAEYVPFRSVLTRVVGRLDHLIPRDFAFGTAPGRFHVSTVDGTATIRFGDVICYEVAFDGLVRAAVGGGSQLLVVQSNNATFGRSGETGQQLAMSRLRAVEHGRTVVVATTSGISAVIAPDGRVLARSKVFTRAVLVLRVPLRTQPTIADRLGGAVELGLALAGVLAIGSAAWQGRRPRRDPRRGGAPAGVRCA